MILIHRIFSPWIQVYLKIKTVKTVTRVCLPHTKNSAKRDTFNPYCDDKIPYTRVKQTRNTRIPNHWQGRKLVLAKGAFIIYPEGGGGGGGAVMILRGVTLSPYYDLGGDCGKFPTKMTLSLAGTNHFFPEIEKEIKICWWTLI